MVVQSLAHGKRRFHWRYEEPNDRRKAVALIGRLHALHLVVVGIGLENPRQERGRRQCMTRLLWELEQRQVAEVWLDARRPKQNADDHALVDGMRRSHQLNTALHVDHAYAAEEPLTWLPDIVAGAASAAYGDDNWQYLSQLERVLEEPVLIHLS